MIVNDVPLPILLNSSMQEVSHISPSRMSLELSLTPLSTSTMELPKGVEVPQRAWVKLYNSAGFVGIFRTHAPTVDCMTGESTIVLEHGVCEIGDYLITTDLKLNGTATEVFTAIMGYYGGTLWQLGQVEPTVSIKAESDHGNVLQTLLEAMEALPGYMIAFDQSSLPWTLSIVARPTTVSGEGRLTRNVQSASIMSDDSELCTRVYMDKLTNGYLDADTQSTYGLIEHRIDGDDDLTAAEALEIAQMYLAKRKNPVLSVTISLTDLSMITGEALDEIHVGQMYRLVMPDGTAVTQTVVSVAYPEVYGSPLSAQVTLAEEADTMSSVAAGLQLQMSKVTKAYYRLNKAIIGDEESLTILSRDISLVAGDLQNTRIDLDAQGIRLSTVESTTTAMSTTLDRAGINLSAQNGISLYADHTELDRVAGVASANSAELLVQSGQIAAKVSNGDVATQLAVEVGNVSISGGNLVVDGYVLASELGADIAALTELRTTSIRTDELVSYDSTLTYITSSYIEADTVVVDGSDIASSAVGSIGPADVSSATGGVSIPWSYVDGSPGTAITFNIANTQYYRDGVAAAYAQGVIDGGSSVSVDGYDVSLTGSPYFNAQNVLMQDIEVVAWSSSGGSTQYLSAPLTVTRSVMSAYNMGLTDGAASVTQRTAVLASAIQLSQNDTGVSNQSTTVYYDNNTNTPSVPIQIDASNVYAKGYTTGEGDVTVSGAWNGTKYTATATNGATVSTGNLSFSGSWGSGNTANLYSFTVKDGSTTIISDSINASSRYDAGRAVVGISGSWNGATYTATTTGQATAHTVSTTLVSHTDYLQGAVIGIPNITAETIVKGGNSYRLPKTVSSASYTLQGNRCTTTLYRESGGNYYRYDTPLYFGGSTRTLYSCSNFDTMYEGSSYTCYKLNGTTSYYYQAGTQITYYTIPS